MGRCPSFDMEMRRFTQWQGLLLLHSGGILARSGARPERNSRHAVSFAYPETLQIIVVAAHTFADERRRTFLRRRRRRSYGPARVGKCPNMLAPLLAEAGEKKLFSEYEFLAHGFLDRIRNGDERGAWAFFIDYRNGAGTMAMAAPLLLAPRFRQRRPIAEFRRPTPNTQ